MRKLKEEMLSGFSKITGRQVDDGDTGPHLSDYPPSKTMLKDKKP